MPSSKHLTRNKILVIGRRGVGKLALIKTLIAKSGQPPPDIPNETSLTSHAGLKIPWNIDNKYYRAQVLFWVDEILDDEKEEPQQDNVMKWYLDKENGIGEVVDAIVFIFQKDKPFTFKDLSEWIPFVEHYEPAITLCVASSSVSSSEGEKVEVVMPETDYAAWCFDNGFEYVSLDEVEQREESADDEEGYSECVGIDRVLEALQSHMWEGMKRKKARAQDELPEEDSEEDHAFYKAIAGLNVSEGELGSGTTPLQDSDDEDYEFGDSIGADMLDFNDDFEMPTNREVEIMGDELFGDIDGEDGLEKAFHAIQGLREKGLALPDSERRKLAAQVALSFSRQLDRDR